MPLAALLLVLALQLLLVLHDVCLTPRLHPHGLVVLAQLALAGARQH